MSVVEVRLVEEFRRDFGITRLVCWAKLGESNYLVCMPDKMLHVQRFKPPKQYNYSFRLLTFIPELNYIVGVGGGIPNVIILANEPGFPLISENYRLSTACYDRILYCKKDRTLFIVGSGVEILSMKEKRKMFEANPTVKVSCKASLPQSLFGTSSCQVEIDEMRDRFFISSKCGFSIYSLSGKLIREVTDMPVLPFQSVCVRNSKDLNKQPIVYPFKMMLTTDANGLLRLWNDSVRVIDSFDDKGTVYIFSQFLNSEFVLMVTNTNKVILFDVITKRKVVMCSLSDDPVTMDLVRECGHTKFIVLTRQTLTEYEVVVPWKLFIKGAELFTDIRRWPSHQYSARIALLSNSGLVYFVSPEIREILLSVGSQLQRTVNYFYDRGCVRIKDQMLKYGASGERIVCEREDGSLLVWQASGEKFVESFCSQSDVSNLTFVLLKNMHRFFVAVLNRIEIVLLNFDTLKLEKRETLAEEGPISVRYHFDSERIYVFYEYKYVVLHAKDFTTDTIVQFTERLIDADIGDDIFVLGFESGHVKTHRLSNPENETVLDVSDDIRQVVVEYNSVIILTKQNKVFLMDMEGKVIEVQAPFPVYAAGFLNSNLDLLVSLGYEIMVIKKSSWLSSLVNPPSCLLDCDDASKEILAKGKLKPSGGIRHPSNGGESLESADKSTSQKAKNEYDKMARMRKRFQQMKKRAEEGSKAKEVNEDGNPKSDRGEGHESDEQIMAGSSLVPEQSSTALHETNTGEVDTELRSQLVTTSENGEQDESSQMGKDTFKSDQDESMANRKGNFKNEHSKEDKGSSKWGQDEFMAFGKGEKLGSDESSTLEKGTSKDESLTHGVSQFDEDKSLLSGKRGSLTKEESEATQGDSRESSFTPTSNAQTLVNEPESHSSSNESHSTQSSDSSYECDLPNPRDTTKPTDLDIYATETVYEVKENNDSSIPTKTTEEDPKPTKKKKPNKRKKRHARDTPKGHLAQLATAFHKDDTGNRSKDIHEPNASSKAPRKFDKSRPVCEPGRTHSNNPRLAKRAPNNSDRLLHPPDHTPCRSFPVMETLKPDDVVPASILAEPSRTLKQQLSADNGLLITENSIEESTSDIIEEDLVRVPLSQTSSCENGLCAVRSVPSVIPSIENPWSLVAEEEPSDSAGIHPVRSTVDILKPWDLQPASLPTRPMHIRPLNINRASVPFAPDRSRLQEIPRLRDGRPLGNIELAVKIVKPNVPKR